MSLLALARQLDTRRRLRERMYAARLAVVREQLRAIRGTYA